jgi:uncharacterized membrane protein
MFGVMMGIIKFEFKYVEKLHSGERPEHKKFLEKLRKLKRKKAIFYSIGFFLMLLPLLLLMTDTIGVDKEMITIYSDSNINYLWGYKLSALFIGVQQFIYFGGLIMIILPILSENKPK